MRDGNNAAHQFWGDSLTRCIYESTNGGGGHMVGHEELAVERGFFQSAGPLLDHCIFRADGFLKIREHILPLYKFRHYNLTSPSSDLLRASGHFNRAADQFWMVEHAQDVVENLVVITSSSFPPLRPRTALPIMESHRLEIRLQCFPSSETCRLAPSIPRVHDSTTFGTKSRQS